VRVYVGVTDGAWYRFLVDRPYISEVNFWMPGGGRLRMTPGEPFAFKTHAPDNRIVGGGRFDSSILLPVSDAWRIYGEGNGVASLDAMRAAIGRYRKAPISPDEDPVIGCVLLREVVFLDAAEVMPAPSDWAGNIVRGKYYEAVGGIGESIVERLLSAVVDRFADGPRLVPGEVFGGDELVRRRLGQKAFQAIVLDAYRGRCAVTGERIRPVLQAAHIQPVSIGGQNRIDNGLLLRSDVHTLFDAGYLGVDPKFRLMVSPRLRAEFDNGEEFYGRAGREIALPEKRVERPAREFLEWHADARFLR
jgi:putative restriction endonuclease